MARPKILRYSLNQKFRRIIKRIMRLVTVRSTEAPLDIHTEEIKKILLVRATFRMGDSVLALPAISVFRKNFPNARIDFVGAPISRTLFQNLPIDHHFSITRRYPRSGWDYPALIRKLRAVGYDLAVDVSCSQSAMGSFIVGFSRARFRIGLQGEHDRWFNVRICRPPENNKYRILPIFLRVLGLDGFDVFPSLVFSPAEKEEGKQKLNRLLAWDRSPIVGVFIGGRKTWAKRWPIDNFCQLITALHWKGLNVVTFFGPEEKSLIGVFKDALEPNIPLVYEPSSRNFAAMVSNCDLFVTCDTGPMHLACALGIRTVSIFQHANFDHWGPPPTLGRVVYQDGGCSAEEIFRICLEELPNRFASVPESFVEGVSHSSSVVKSVPQVTKAIRRLGKSLFLQKLLLLSRCGSGLFVLALIFYVWLFPPSGIFEDGTWLEAFTDSVGIASIIAGGFLHVGARTHIGAWTGPDRLMAPTLIMRGPYAYVRHPLYLANLLLGLGLMILLEAFPLIPLLLALVAFHLIVLIPAEEAFLKEKFSEGYELYCDLVPPYTPNIMPDLLTLSRGVNLPLRQLGAVVVLIGGACLFEWLEAPQHRRVILDLFRIVASRVSL